MDVPALLLSDNIINDVAIEVRKHTRECTNGS